MAYNMTWVDNTTQLPQLVLRLNEVTNGFFSLMLLVVIWFIFFAAFKNFDTVDDMIITNFIMSIIAGLFWFMGITIWAYVMVPVVLLVVAVLYKYFR